MLIARVKCELLQKTVVGQLETPQLTNNNNLDSLFIPMVVSLGIFGTILLVWFLNSFLCVCKPNEVVILSGRKHKTSSGQEVGYRVLTGGRGIRIPILETVKRIDVTTMPVTVKVTNAYAKGGTPLDIQAIANVKISSDPQVVGNAIERFLDQDRQEIIRVARETLGWVYSLIFSRFKPSPIILIILIPWDAGKLP
jgi:flotillin